MPPRQPAGRGALCYGRSPSTEREAKGPREFRLVERFRLNDYGPRYSTMFWTASMPESGSFVAFILHFLPDIGCAMV